MREDENKKLKNRNWPKEHWDKLSEELIKLNIVPIAIGTLNDSIAPIGCIDKRNISLEELVDLMANAKLIVGPSSGPMHLASLCKTPSLVWTDDCYRKSIEGSNKERYESIWNPLDSPVRVLETGWTPDVELILTHIKQKITFDLFVDKWGKRSKKGPSYVSHVGQDHNKQGEKIKAMLLSSIGEQRFKHAIDFGSGWGRFIPTLLSFSDTITAIDIVPEILPKADKNVKTMLFDWPFVMKTEKADFVFACLVLQHIVNEDLFENACLEISKLAAPGARVIIIDNAIDVAPHVKPRGPDKIAKALGLAPFSSRLVTINMRQNDHWMIDGIID
jgi:hypothetical protein